MRTVRELAEARSEDPADEAAAMLEDPDDFLRTLDRDVKRIKDKIAQAQREQAGYRKAGAGATMAVDLVRAHLVTPFKYLLETATKANDAVQRIAK